MAKLSGPKKTKNRPWMLWAITLFALFCGITLFYTAKVQIIDTFEKTQRDLSQNTVFYDIHNQPFHIIQGSESRKYVKISAISKNLQKAVLAIEDARFYYHPGFDPIRMAGAALHAVKNGKVLQGASTVTQQLAKISLLTPERTLSRKIKELFIAVAFELEYSKAEILEFYLNQVYLGHRNYGVENASLNYFHKSALHLSTAEAAFIAGLIKKPEGYSPYLDLEKSRSRQLIVLRRMLTLKWINYQEYQEAVKEQILIRRTPVNDLKMAPYFTNHILLQLIEKYKGNRVYGGGLKVYTTLDREIQHRLEVAIAERIAQERSFEQVAAVSLDPATGYIKGLVGGINFEESEFNRATQAERQPGSAFKPILYATALTTGLAPNDRFVDEPTRYTNINEKGEEEIYAPENFNGEHLGTITMAHALKVSNNVVSVKILERIGIPALINLANRFRVSQPNRRGLCLALGCGETTLLRLTSAYGVFENGGVLQEPVFLLKVTDAEGHILEEHQPTQGTQVLSSDQAYLMRQMLKNVIESGTGRAAKIDTPAAGKTGTSDDFRDAWFVGFVPHLVSGFWIGNDDNSSMIHEVGGRTPARLWRTFMTSLPEQLLPQKEFAINEEFEDFQLCDNSGFFPGPWCPSRSWYPLRKGQEIEEFCDIHVDASVERKVCLSSGLLASRYCPLDLIESRFYNEGDEPKEFCNVHIGPPPEIPQEYSNQPYDEQPRDLPGSQPPLPEEQGAPANQEKATTSDPYPPPPILQR